MNTFNSMLVVLVVCTLAACSDSRGASASPPGSEPAMNPAMRVYIDPATGQPGLPPGTQVGRLTTQSLREVVPATPTYTRHADGTVEMHLNRKQELRATLDGDGDLHQDERSVPAALVGSAP